MCDSALIIAEMSINPQAILFPRGVQSDSSPSVLRRLCHSSISYLFINFCAAHKLLLSSFSLSTVCTAEKEFACALSPTTLFYNFVYFLLRRLRATHFHPHCSVPAKFSLFLCFTCPSIMFYYLQIPFLIYFIYFLVVSIRNCMTIF